jgi:outer membrane protein TolC
MHHSCRAGLTALFLISAAGCGSSLSAIDAKLDAAMAERSRALGDDALNPYRAPKDASPAPRARTLVKTPGSVNPDAAELTFSPASEARDVAGRLATYSESVTAPLYLRAEPPFADVHAAPEGLRPLMLEDVFRQGQRTAREYLSFEDDYLLSAIRLLQERHLWDVRFFNDTTATLSGSGDRGEYEHAASLVNNLRATKRLPFGGDIEAAWVTRATDQLRERVSGGYQQSSELVLSGNIPLLAGAGPIAREALIQAERSLVYQARTFERDRRSLLVDLATDYFRLLESQQRIVNQRRQLESLLILDQGERARVEAGRRAAFQQKITENQVETARSTLASLTESYVLQLDRFKIRLGLDPGDLIDVLPVAFEIPEPEIGLDEAAALALEYRLDLQNRRDQADDAARDVENAKNSLLPRFDLNGSVGIPTEPFDATGGASISPEDLDYSASATLSLPLDRRNERLAVRSAEIALDRSRRALSQARDEVVISVRSALRSIDLARVQLEIAERQVAINELRVDEMKLKADEVEPRDRVDAENDLLSAKNDAERARTNLRLAVLNYLLESDQLRVNKDGTFQPLPGMRPQPAEPPADQLAPATETPAGT